MTKQRLVEIENQPEIEITPEMVEAGVYAIREHILSPNWRDVVKDIYHAMENERLDVLR